MNVDVSELFRMIGELTVENRLLKEQVDDLTPPVSELRPLSDTALKGIRDVLA